MKKNFTILFIIGCCLLQPVKAVDTPWYEIEVIVFEHTNQNRLESEKWDQQNTLAKVDDSIDFITVDPATIHLKQICLKGNMVDILETIPVTEVLEVEEDIENNLEDVTLSNVADIEPPIEPEQLEKPFTILAKEYNQLNDLHKTLSRRRGYHPLLHISWRQPIKRKKSKQLIRLYAGNNYSETFNQKGDARVDIATFHQALDEEVLNPEQIYIDASNNQSLSIDNSEQSNDSPFTINSSELPVFGKGALQTAADYRRQVQDNLSTCQQIYQQQAEQKNPDVWQLDGNIKLYAERYLHIETDLYLRIPGKKEMQIGAIETSLAADRLLNSLETSKDTDNGFGWQLGDDFLLDDQSQSTIMQDVLNKYLMKQSRRLRRNEIHYIDHPLFGLLIQIRAYEKKSTIAPPVG